MRYFVAVAEHGNFTRAADELHVAQQAVSQQIRALEATLGVTLLRRSSRKVELTPAGAVFLADAKRVLAASDRATLQVRAAAHGEVGTLRLVYTLVTAFETTPSLLVWACPKVQAPLQGQRARGLWRRCHRPPAGRQVRCRAHADGLAPARAAP